MPTWPKITGQRIDPETGAVLHVPEADHFYVCSHCGQAVDKRDLGQVFHHEELEHEPLQVDS